MRLAEELRQPELESISKFVLVNDPEYERRMRFHCAMYFRSLISSFQKKATTGDTGGFIWKKHRRVFSHWYVQLLFFVFCCVQISKQEWNSGKNCFSVTIYFVLWLIRSSTWQDHAQQEWKNSSYVQTLDKNCTVRMSGTVTLKFSTNENQRETST